MIKAILPMPILICQAQICALQAQLEFVTNQDFEFHVIENDATTLLCTWHNSTQIDYILHVLALKDSVYQVALAVKRYRTIETRFDRRLNTLEAHRLFDDPRLCVQYWVGQIRDF